MPIDIMVVYVILYAWVLHPLFWCVLIKLPCVIALVCVVKQQGWVLIVCYGSSWSISHFNLSEEDWSKYAEGVVLLQHEWHYWWIQEMTHSSKQCGTINISSYIKFSSSRVPGYFSHENLVSKVKAHKEPTPSIVVMCFQFNTRNQKLGKSIA